MTGRDGTEAHQLQDKPRGVFISRSDVAHGMLDAVDRAETIRQTIGIAY